MLETNLRKRDAVSEWTITADNAERVARAIRICVGKHLQEMYGEILEDPVPPKIADLLRRLDRRTAVEPSLREGTNVEFYLAEAKFSAELAESNKRPDYKDRWLKIAQEWRDLADQAGGKVTQHRH
jgi:Anti-sigma factor NepR